MHDTNQSAVMTAGSTNIGENRLGNIGEHRRVDAGPAAAQRTLRHAISCVGVGRHSGARVGLTLQPAGPDTGVRFRRSDRPGASSIKARPEHLVIAEHALILADGDGMRIVGIEHVVAALAMTGIDNAVIEVNGPELPAMDGSAQPFVFLIECAGAIEQDAAHAACPAPASVDLRSGDAIARIASSAAPHLAADISGMAVAAFGGPVHHAVALQRDALRHELAAARQSLTSAELEAAQGRGLMRGVSLENTLIIESARPLNAGGFRFSDEAARHANLLALASLALLGGLPPVELLTKGASHALLARLLRQCSAAALVGVRDARTDDGTVDGVGSTAAPTLATIGQRASSPV